VLQVNTQQKRIQNSWPQSLWVFTKREWLSLFLSAGLGILIGSLIHLVRQDHAFQNSVATHYKPWVSFDDARYYLPYLIATFVVILLALGPLLGSSIWRGLKSWGLGVTSGLVLVPFACALCIALLPTPTPVRRLILGICLAIAYFFGSFRLFLHSKLRAARTVTEAEFIVPSKVRSLAGSQLEWSDDPIQTWSQDALGRAALVDSLSVKIMVAKVPVILLSGPFGSGKTSTLNLLRAS
jgi:hypothetical protein